MLRNVSLMQRLAQHERVQQMHEALERQREELEQRLATITAQAETIRRLSTPVLELGDGVLVLPIIGAIDPHRAENMMEGLLTRLVATRARSVILDVTGVDALDAAAADHLLRVTRAASLLGARCVLTGVRPAVADTLAGLGVGFGDLRVFRDLGAGLRHCLQEKAERATR
ncbi:STAS domain-containing protein [Nannocystis pusilla]|uniref:STAS domain-containing protein n=1 Tax=Nannocystis pusilla TaxID=889268 RepID=UPI003DA60F81